MNKGENKRHNERARERDHWLMRREDGDDNGDNGSHSGPGWHIASSSLALGAPSVGRGENASKMTPLQ